MTKRRLKLVSDNSSKFSTIDSINKFIQVVSNYLRHKKLGFPLTEETKHNLSKDVTSYWDELRSNVTKNVWACPDTSEKYLYVDSSFSISFDSSNILVTITDWYKDMSNEYVMMVAADDRHAVYDINLFKNIIDFPLK
jgi:hypothetical protein